MQQNSLNKKQMSFSARKDNVTKMTIIIVLLVSFCVIVFAGWLFFITFIASKPAQETGKLEKRLKIDSKQYEQVMTQLKNDESKPLPAVNNDPFGL